METQSEASLAEQDSLPQETNDNLSPVSNAPVVKDTPVDKFTQDVAVASASQQTQIHTNRQNRHSKRLSLNFPILVPHGRKGVESTSPSFSMSPTMTPSSGGSTPQFQLRSHPLSSMTATSLSTPLTPPSESLEVFSSRSRSPNRRRHGHKAHARSQTLAHSDLQSSLTPPLSQISPSQSSEHLDFLTLLASQERRVLELKEELYRAETELQSLKKQWAVHEASRKKGELRNGGVVKMGVLKSPSTNTGVHGVPRSGRGHARSATVAPSAGLGLSLAIDEEEQQLNDAEHVGSEKEKRRSLLQEEKFRRRGTTMEDGNTTTGRRSGQRVFSGSRHTRTLSLLTSTPNLGLSDTSKGISVSGSAKSVSASTSATDDAESRSAAETHTSTFPSLTRSNSGFGRELNFGKTYKDLASAASRRTMPQGADVLMKHGKVVVDGVRDGLWSFFEDIRQATVGEEAARELSVGNESSNGVSRKGSAGSIKTGSKTSFVDTRSSKAHHPKSAEQSFWREFGMDTPAGDRKKSVANTESLTRSKSLRSKGASASCHRHAHNDRISEGTDAALQHEDANAESLPRPMTKNDEETPDNTRSSMVQKKEHHVSHSSTDSGDSRGSRNPPSLTMDSPYGGSSRNNDTDMDEGEDVDDETWDWKESDSPSQVRSRDVLAKERVTNTGIQLSGVDISTKMDQSTDQSHGHVREHSQQGYDWHALTR